MAAKDIEWLRAHFGSFADYLYRAARGEERAQLSPEVAEKTHPSIKVKRADGSEVPLDLGRLEFIVNEACEGLADVSAQAVLDEALKSLFDGVSENEVNTSLVTPRPRKYD